MILAELIKQTRRPRAWVTLAAMAAIPALLTLVIGATRPTLSERLGDFGAVVTDSSGLTMPAIALSAMLLFMLPLAVAVFAGECVAGEAASGSLRYLLARPVARWRVLAAKALVAALYSAAAVAVVVGVALIAGALAFGLHPLTVLDLQHTTPFIVVSAKLAPPVALMRTALAALFILACLSSTFSFALLASTLSARPFSAVAGAVGLGLVSRALDNVPGLHALSPWLPMTDEGSNQWTGFFAQQPQAGAAWHVLAVQGGYSALFLAAAFIWFNRADVLS